MRTYRLHLQIGRSGLSFGGFPKFRSVSSPPAFCYFSTALEMTPILASFFLILWLWSRCHLLLNSLSLASRSTSWLLSESILPCRSWERFCDTSLWLCFKLPALMKFTLGSKLISAAAQMMSETYGRRKSGSSFAWSALTLGLSPPDLWEVSRPWSVSVGLPACFLAIWLFPALN